MSYNPQYYKFLSSEKKKKRHAQMQAYNRKLQTFLKELMYFALGRQCAKCGDKTDLTFDVKIPVGFRHHRINTSQRYRFYFQQMLQGNLQVLCFSCNASKQDKTPNGYAWRFKTNKPEVIDHNNEPF